MKSNMYLYNTEDVPDIPQEIIVRRLELLKDHLSELMDVPIEQRGKVRLRIHDVEKAISYWENINSQ